MKRVCAFVGIICLMLSAIAVRLYFCRLNVFVDGVYTAFDGNDNEIKLSISKGYERVDTEGGIEQTDKVLSKLKARVVKTERVGNSEVLYAYSPCLLKSVSLFDERVNLMIAITGSDVVIGSPIIKGSF